MRLGSVSILAFIAGITLLGVAVSFGLPGQDTGLETFASEDAFRQYIDRSTEIRRTAVTGGTQEFDSVQARTTESLDSGGDGGAGEQQVDRVSRTNVQHEGIDEPDIVKTDGETIYISRSAARQTNITLIDALPPQQADIIASIRGTAGDWWQQADQLLLNDDTLTAIGDNEVRGYNISDPSSPEQIWMHGTNGTVQTARMYDGSIYLVVREGVDRDSPCPIRPLGDASVIPCTSIYHPSSPADVDVTYSVLEIGQSGEVVESTSFVGSQQDTVVYMSRNGLYLTYSRQKPRAEIMTEFFTSDGADLLDEQARMRLQRLQGYELSEQARLAEVQDILARYRDRLDQDERLTLEQEMENRFGNWTRRNMREFVRSGIVRVGIDDLEVEETGEVPGIPLNQFSMDEHEGALRIATTVSSPVQWQVSTNDLYVLDEDLDIQGRVEDMGVDQRIYSVRFMGDEGYIVTFRRIDPFYVLDLSDPTDPTLEGELKLPGFSSYLHPLEEDRILGVGEEDGQVKAVIFDVSDPADPTIEDEYRLTDRWSAISDSHHAFLQDERHGVFFLPASSGGYIFSYEEGLELEKAVDVPNAQRAVYVNDYLYIIAETRLVVLDESDWSRVRTLDLPSRRQIYEPLPEPMPR